MVLTEVIGMKSPASSRRRKRDRSRAHRHSRFCASAGVVGKVVEYFGPGIGWLTIATGARSGKHVARIRRDLRHRSIDDGHAQILRDKAAAGGVAWSPPTQGQGM